MKTLVNTLKLSSGMSLSKLKLIMDKGFFSEKNIKKMLSEKFKFIIGIPFTLKMLKEYIDKVRTIINAPNNCIDVNGDIYFCESIITDKYGKNLTVHIFFNEKKYVDEKSLFMQELLQIEGKFKEKDIDKIPKNYEKYFTVTGKKHIALTRNEEAINLHMQYMGYFALLSNCKEESKKALEIYRRKELVENLFDDIKNELDMNRLRIHNDSTFQGKVFVIFIASILKSHINKIMRDNKLYSNYTIVELLRELNKIKNVVLNNTISYMSEISSKQEKIYSVFGVELPNI